MERKEEEEDIVCLDASFFMNNEWFSLYQFIFLFLFLSSRILWYLVYDYAAISSPRLHSGPMRLNSSAFSLLPVSLLFQLIRFGEYVPFFVTASVKLLFTKFLSDYLRIFGTYSCWIHFPVHFHTTLLVSMMPNEICIIFFMLIG